MDLLQSREIDTVLDSVYKVNIVSLPGQFLTNNENKYPK